MKSLDDRGDHITVCRGLAGYHTRRHHRVSRALANVAKAAGLDADTFERPLGYDGGPVTAGRRPNDVTIRRIDGSRIGAVDVTVTTDLSTPAERAEKGKQRKHGPVQSTGSAEA
jgi:hypothetical protein